MNGTVIFGDRDLTIEDIWALAGRRAETRLSDTPAVRDLIARSAGFVIETLETEVALYGVTTGYGDSCTTPVSDELVPELPLHLTRFHGCGMGRLLTEEETRAVIAVRLASLVRGWSGVSPSCIDRLIDMLRLDILPNIPAEGSVGASGDLTPLSYVAGALVGERMVRVDGRELSAADAFKEAGLEPLSLQPKEALALMNGTAVMSGLGALAYKRADWLSGLATRLAALACLALHGNPAHFGARLFEAKPHPGQSKVAARMRSDLAAFAARHAPSRVQDRYSIRCAPHIIGVLEDMLPTFRTLLETEINSANDNPLIDPQDGSALHGGHFYGGHIAFVMDSLKNLVANLADLMDRQMALLVDIRYNNGLPPNLSGSTGPRSPINHGLKAVQIAMSSWAAEALKLTMPASAFSRSTECHNQDKVPMGTIAARDALRVLRLTEQVAAGLTVACVQALRLRRRSGELRSKDFPDNVAEFLDVSEAAIPFIEEDAPLDELLHQLCDVFDRQEWPLEWPEKQL